MFCCVLLGFFFFACVTTAFTIQCAWNMCLDWESWRTKADSLTQSHHFLSHFIYFRINAGFSGVYILFRWVIVAWKRDFFSFVVANVFSFQFCHIIWARKSKGFLVILHNAIFLWDLHFYFMRGIRHSRNLESIQTMSVYLFASFKIFVLFLLKLQINRFLLKTTHTLRRFGFCTSTRRIFRNKESKM